MGGVEKGFSSSGVGRVGLGSLVGDGYVAIENSAGLGGSISHVFEYVCEGGVIVFFFVDLADWAVVLCVSESHRCRSLGMGAPSTG